MKPVKLKVVSGGVRKELLKEWSQLRRDIVEKDLRAFGFVGVMRDGSVLTMAAQPDGSNALHHLISGTVILQGRLLED